ncbi:hypothetical protein HZC31_01110 [Candidatus Woesearchaeota archaeon]|nr:hypothetical protein [Candidatus Woesearchaeota archaeon]
MINAQKHRKAQAAIEFLFVVGFAMLLLIPSLALFGRFVQESSYTVTTSQVNKIGNYMLSTAKTVYHGTNGTVIVIEVNFPEGVTDMEIPEETHDQIIFTMDIGGAETQQVYYSDIPINGTFSSSDVLEGIKKFRLEAINNGALVQIERLIQ